MDFPTFRDFVIRFTGQSRMIARKYFRTRLDVLSKEDMSPVTIADREIEELFRNEVLRKFPGHGVFGEEFGEIKGSSPYYWVIDPIDGTKSFIHGAPLFCTLIALMKGDEPVFGAIHNPILDDLVLGDGTSAYHNGAKISLRSCTSLSEATLLTTDPLGAEKYREPKGFDNLAKACKLYRTWGDAYGYFLVATGFADIMIDPKMSKWDIMALIPVIKGAGGTITDYYGGDPVKGDSIVVSNPTIHQEILNFLKP